MPWWGWVTVGAILLVAELSVVDLEFYLVFLGVSALLVGLLGLSGIALPFWAEWLTFAGLAVGSLVFFRQRVYAKLRPPPEEEIPTGVEGDFATASERIEPGSMGAVTLRGASWQAQNVGGAPIERGSRCRVVRSIGTTLEVEA